MLVLMSATTPTTFIRMPAASPATGRVSCFGWDELVDPTTLAWRCTG